MIYPASRAIILAAIGMPLTLIAALVNQRLWLVGIAWLVLVAGMVVADALLGAWRSELKLEPLIPTALPMGAGGQALVTAIFEGKSAPREMEFMLEANGLIDVVPRKRTVPLLENGGRTRTRSRRS